MTLRDKCIDSQIKSENNVVNVMHLNSLLVISLYM